MDIGTVNLDISGLSDTALGQVDSAYKCWALVYSGAPSDSGTVFCVHDEHHTVISSAASFLIGRSNDTHDLSMIRTDIQIHEENLGPHLLTLVLDKWITKSGVLLAVNAAILSESAVINERTSLGFVSRCSLLSNEDENPVFTAAGFIFHAGMDTAVKALVDLSTPAGGLLFGSCKIKIEPPLQHVNGNVTVADGMTPRTRPLHA
ncbi:hypothetical protein PLESTB_000217300 [Pleodorina starrii]|uniref:Uncharacterized protein n=1 Tax=Pleodorina starrii TaxID=330485 RepID=A0A9W6BCU0_9CHLO|nr:hypothetical protein PLESTB_000217300 [Pleodorina starrii]